MWKNTLFFLKEFFLNIQFFSSFPFFCASFNRSNFLELFDYDQSITRRETENFGFTSTFAQSSYYV